MLTDGAAQAVSKDSQVKMAGYCTATQAFGLIFGPLASTYLYQFDQKTTFLFFIRFSDIGRYMYLLGFSQKGARNEYFNRRLNI